jgi:hypothetical protein
MVGGDYNVREPHSALAAHRSLQQPNSNSQVAVVI